MKIPADPQILKSSTHLAPINWLALKTSESCFYSIADAQTELEQMVLCHHCCYLEALKNVQAVFKPYLTLNKRTDFNGIFYIFLVWLGPPYSWQSFFQFVSFLMRCIWDIIKWICKLCISKCMRKFNMSTFIWDIMSVSSCVCEVFMTLKKECLSKCLW